MDGYGEIRFYNGKLHAKSTLIDDQLLIFSSQNMRSAWGKGILKEHSLATNSPAAIDEFKTFFETKWKVTVPFENTQFGTSP